MSRTAELKEKILFELQAGGPINHSNASGRLAEMLNVPADGVFKDAVQQLVEEGGVEKVVKGRRTQHLAATNEQVGGKVAKPVVKKAAPKPVPMTFADILAAREEEIANRIAQIDDEMASADREREALSDEAAMVGNLLAHIDTYGYGK